MATVGKSVITSIIKTDYDYWDNIHQNTQLYKLEKEKIGKAFMEEIEKRFPKTRGKIEIVDVATPLTYSRYTGTWKGSYLGWWGTLGKTQLSTIPELNGFYMAGQWSQSSGGVPTAMTSGRDIINSMVE